MKLGLLKRIPKEQLSKAGGELPNWIDALLAPLNDFIDKVGIAMQGQLTFEDNFLCKIVEQNFVSGSAKEINPRNDGQGNLRVYGVIPIASGTLKIRDFGWITKNNGNIDVTFDFASGTEATCRIIILLR